MGLKKKQPNQDPIRVATSDPAGEDVREYAAGRVVSIPARLRPIGRRSEALTRDAGLLDVGEGGEGNDWYFFSAEISSTALDAYFTHMDASTLRNFARDAAEGRALLDSHDGYKLGVGYSAGGRFEEEDGEGRAVATFYIVPGIHFGGKHSFASTDDFIRAIEGEVVRDVSVGFHGGRWVCDLCSQPYFGRGSACNHIAGWEYEIERDGKMVREVCTVTIHDAELSEVSLVYDGATPGAMILKAEQEAAAGRLSPAMVRQLERQYRVKLPGGAGEARVLPVTTASTAEAWTLPVTTASTGYYVISPVEVNGERAMEEEEVIETMDEVVDEAGQAQPEQDELRQVVEEIRQVVSESAAPGGVTLAASVRWLNEQLAAAVGERDRALGQVAELQPLADQGRAYRDELVNQAVAEGVRAMGEAFPEETYRGMLAGAPLEHIRQVRDTFAAQAAERFPGGRQTRDRNEGKGPARQSQTPVAAYGA